MQGVIDRGQNPRISANLGVIKHNIIITLSTIHHAESKPQATRTPAFPLFCTAGAFDKIIMFDRAAARIIPSALLLLLLLLLSRLPDRASSLSSSSFRPSKTRSFHPSSSSSSSPFYSSPIRLPHNGIILHCPTTAATTTTTTAASSILPCRPLRSSSSGSVEDGNGIAISPEEETPLSLAMAVGVVSSFVGFAYSKCMKAGFKLLWKTVPSALLLVGGGGGASGGCAGCCPPSGFAALVRRHPAAYIPIVVTIGGSMVATLSTLFFPKLFSAHDMVRILSGGGDGRRADASLIPSARAHLLPVMMLCCLTSITGFSLGPEAPMVRARPRPVY